MRAPKASRCMKAWPRSSRTRRPRPRPSTSCFAARHPQRSRSAALAHIPGDSAAAGYTPSLARQGAGLARAWHAAADARLAAAADRRCAYETRNPAWGSQAVSRPLARARRRPPTAPTLRKLARQKESLEKELAGAVPTRPARPRGSPPFTDLADRLPDRAAFIDLYRYARVERRNPEIGGNRLRRFCAGQGQAGSTRGVGRRLGPGQGLGGLAGRHHQGLP